MKHSILIQEQAMPQALLGTMIAVIAVIEVTLQQKLPVRDVCRRLRLWVYSRKHEIHVYRHMYKWMHTHTHTHTHTFGPMWGLFSRTTFPANKLLYTHLIYFHTWLNLLWGGPMMSHPLCWVMKYKLIIYLWCTIDCIELVVAKTTNSTQSVMHHRYIIHTWIRYSIYTRCLYCHERLKAKLVHEECYQLTCPSHHHPSLRLVITSSQTGWFFIV